VFWGYRYHIKEQDCLVPRVNVIGCNRTRGTHRKRIQSSHIGCSNIQFNLEFYAFFTLGRDSSVGIATGYGLDGRRIESR
jgi:hypothetical protein